MSLARQRVHAESWHTSMSPGDGVPRNKNGAGSDRAGGVVRVGTWCSRVDVGETVTQPPSEAGGENLPVKRPYRPANSPRDKFGPVVPAPIQPQAEPAPAAVPAPPVGPASPPEPPPVAPEGEERVPGGLPVPAGNRLPAKRRRRFVPRNTTRTTVIAMLLVMVVVCGGGIAAVGLYFFGDTVTAKPRSPIETVEGFMQAAFGRRDATALNGYVCADGSQARKVVTEIIESEKRFNDTVLVTWEALTEAEKDGEHATVTARVTKTSIAGGVRHKGPESLWTFTLANESDWKVCAIDVGG